MDVPMSVPMFVVMAIGMPVAMFMVVVIVGDAVSMAMRCRAGPRMRVIVAMQMAATGDLAPQQPGTQKRYAGKTCDLKPMRRVGHPDTCTAQDQ
jgi:hypothetical protein